MIRELEVMTQIQAQKAKNVTAKHALDAEGVAMTEHKRNTFDVKELPSDPLR